MVFDRDRIIETIDLAALADELLGSRRGTSRSATWPCPSPNHAQSGRTPPVGIYRSRSGEERWHCHGCGIGGSSIDLVMATQGVAVADALRELAGRAGMSERLPADRYPRRLPVPRSIGPTPFAGDPERLASFVEECAERLWRPEGRPVLRWLTEVRGLPAEILRCNGIGADPGRGRQDRPEGMPSAGRAAVLPVHEGSRPVFAQLRPISPRPGQPRYLNAASRLASNPRVGFYEPIRPIGRCVFVTEGVLDALSANAAGLHSAAVLGAALAAGEGSRGSFVADRLTQLKVPLILAFDADEPGQHSARLLRNRLDEGGARTARVLVPAAANDLNGWMQLSRDWPQTLGLAARSALKASEPPRSLSR